MLKMIEKLKELCNEFQIAKQNYESRKSELDSLKQEIDAKLLKFEDFEAREAAVKEQFAKVMRDEDFAKATEKLKEERNAFVFERDKSVSDNAKQKQQNEDDRRANLDRAEILAKRELQLEEDKANYKQKIQEELVFKMTGLRPSQVLKPQTVAEAEPAKAAPSN